MIKKLLKIWLLLISIVLLFVGTFYGILWFLLWWHHPYIPYILGITSLLGLCLYGACVYCAFDDD